MKKLNLSHPPLESLQWRAPGKLAFQPGHDERNKNVTASPFQRMGMTLPCRFRGYL